MRAQADALRARLVAVGAANRPSTAAAPGDALGAGLAERDGADRAWAGDAAPSALDDLLAVLGPDRAPVGRADPDAGAGEAPRSLRIARLPGVDERTHERLAAFDAALRDRPDPPAPELATGLAGAAARLRARTTPPVEEPEGDALGSGLGGRAAAATDARPEPSGALRLEPTRAPGPPAAPVAADEASGVAEQAVSPASGAVPARAGRPAPLAPRAVVPGTEGPWLRGALELLAVRDPELAARLLVALLPAQAARIDLAYDVHAHAHAPVRVVLAGGRGTLDAPSPAAPGAFALTGTVAALAPIAAGGAGWRLRGARVRGSRRALLGLLRRRRAPVGLGDLVASGLVLDPALLLHAVAAAVPAALTASQAFGIAYDLGDRVVEVRATDGAPLAVTPGRRTRVAAIVHTEPAALLALLAATPGAAAAVTGDARAVALVHGWFDRARGAVAR
jgi:hypothetical protein